jgi:hypothetical protein
LTSRPSQIEVVTLAVYLLEGDQKPVDTEDVAVKAHEMAPSRFGWKKYPDQVNLELVRVYLSAAKNPSKAGYLDGSGKTGWSLTARGSAWARDVGTKLLARNLNRPREEGGGGPLDEQRWRRERERVLHSRAWTAWSKGESEIRVRDAEAVFRIDSYAVGRLRDLKTARLLSLFENDLEVRDFLGHLAGLIESQPE